VCNPRNHVSRILNIEFERGSAANDAVFSSTVGTIFEMVDPHFDPQRAVEVPFVKIRILDGLDGLLSFVRLVSNPCFADPRLILLSVTSARTDSTAASRSRYRVGGRRVDWSPG
jgi:hypothetical protein